MPSTFVNILVQSFFAIFLIVSIGVSDFNPMFHHIGVEDGLSNDRVYRFRQDKDGFLWIGTQDGLSRYDGYNFENFYNVPQDSNSLPDNAVSLIYQERYERLWIGTQTGIAIYDPGKKHFSRIDVPGVNGIYEGTDNTFFLSSYFYGLIKITTANETLENKQVSKNLIPIKDELSIRTLMAQEDSILWLGTNNEGLLKYDLLDRMYKQYLYAPDSKHIPHSNSIQCIGVDPEHTGALWLGTDNHGLIRFDTKNEIFEKIKIHLPAFVETQPVIKYFYTDRMNRRIWIGTEKEGLIIYDIATREWSHIPVLDDKNNHKAKSISEIYEDRFGNIWIGTFNGIYIYYPPRVETVNFTHRQPSPKNCIWDIATDGKNNLWLATQKGISRYIPKSSFLKTYRPQFLSGSLINESAVHALYFDRDQCLWAGTLHNGLFKIDLKNETIKQIVLKSYYGQATKYFNNVYNIIPGSSSTLWIGTNGLGLVGYDSENEIVDGFYYPGKQKVENHSLWITCLEKDNREHFWAGMWLDGLAVFNPENQTWRVLNEIYPGAQLTHPTVLSLLSQVDTLWIGTYGGGLNRLLLDTGQITCYSTRQGLPNNVIYAIMSDNEGWLWLSTNKGLCRFNPKTETCRTFDRADRINGIEFNLGAAYRSADGTLYFGHEGGLLMVTPKIYTEKVAPMIQITSVKINGRKISFNFKKKSGLKLTSDDKRLTIEFVGLYFRSPGEIEYAYRLEGFDDQWIKSGPAREVTYTNLPPGHYTFKVKACNANKIWSENSAELPVIINPPFWMHWWFYLICLAFAGLVFEGIHQMRIRQRLQLERTKNAEREKIQRKITADFHDELGHRVTKIAYIGHMLKNDIEKSDAQAKKKLQKLIDNSDILLKEMREFVWELDPEKNTLCDLVEQLKSFSDDIFDQTNIAFRIEQLPGECKHITLNLEWRKQILRLFKEAMHNILKHAENCRNVIFQVKVKNNYLILNITDDGCGLPENANEKNGNGLKNMHARAAELGGKLVVRNCNTHGTSVTFSGKLP